MSVAPLDFECASLSVVIPTHNPTHHLITTVTSVLAATKPLRWQVILCDDASSNTELLESIVQDYPDVRLVRHQINLGSFANFNRCIRLAEGDFVHILHSDDAVCSDFYRSTIALMLLEGTSVAFSRAALVNQHGQRVGQTPSLARAQEALLETLLVENIIRTPAVIFVATSRHLQTGFRTDLPHVADWELWLRVVKSGDYSTVDQVLVQYRMHPQSRTFAQTQSGATIYGHFLLRQELVRFSALVQQHPMQSKLSHATAVVICILKNLRRRRFSYVPANVRYLMLILFNRRVVSVQ